MDDTDTDQLECDACHRGDHAHCTDDGRKDSDRACECARSCHGPNGIGIA